MATVLVSFIGIGRPPRANAVDAQVSKSGYERAVYRFPAENGYPAEKLESAIFGSVLLKRLRKMDKTISRWLIMGTQQSVWNDLIDMFPSEQQDELFDVWVKVDEAVKSAPSSLSQPLLDEWQAKLCAVNSETDILCRIVGAADTQESQENVYRELLDAVESGDEVVLDITHGFRHQPVLAAFMTMYLRWARQVKHVEIYYGALDLGSKVLKLDSCARLLAASEAVATFQNTGNYVSLGKCLDFGAEFNQDVQSLAFTEEVNRPDRKTPGRIGRTLSEKIDDCDPLQKSLSEQLNKALSWAGEDKFVKRLRRKADFAFDKEQYFKAVALLWEAILVAGSEKNLNLTARGTRVKAEETLYKILDGSSSQTMRAVENLRNAVLHGTQSNDARVQKALHDKTEFKAIYLEGVELLNKLLLKSA